MFPLGHGKAASNLRLWQINESKTAGIIRKIFVNENSFRFGFFADYNVLLVSHHCLIPNRLFGRTDLDREFHMLPTSVGGLGILLHKILINSWNESPLPVWNTYQKPSDEDIDIADEISLEDIQDRVVRSHETNKSASYLGAAAI